jgi:hypothetical protein
MDMTALPVEQLSVAAAARRAAAVKEYPDLLLRSAAPEAGPAAARALGECLAALGKGPDDASRDREVLRQAAGLEAQASGFAEADARRVEADKVLLGLLRGDVVVSNSRLDAASAEAAVAANASRGARAAGVALEVVRQQHPALFGLPEPPPPPPPATINLIGPEVPLDGNFAIGPRWTGPDARPERRPSF